MIIRSYFHLDNSQISTGFCLRIGQIQETSFGKFIYFTVVFRKLARHTKSAAIPENNNFFYFAFGQHSSQKIRKKNLQKNLRNFFRMALFCFSGLGLENSIAKYKKSFFRKT